MDKKIKKIFIIALLFIIIGAILCFIYTLTGSYFNLVSKKGSKYSSLFFVGHISKSNWTQEQLNNLKKLGINDPFLNSQISWKTEILAYVSLFFSTIIPFVIIAIGTKLGTKGMRKNEKEVWAKKILTVTFAWVAQFSASITLVVFLPRSNSFPLPTIVYGITGLSAFAFFVSVLSITKILIIKEQVIKQAIIPTEDEF